MTAQLIDGKAIASAIREEIRQTVIERLAEGHRAPALATVLVGADPASQVYVRNKRRACAGAGIASLDHNLPADTDEPTLLALIDEFNADPNVDGILVQLPLPERINSLNVIQRIDPGKDVDGFHPLTFGLLALRTPRLRPCTAVGVIRMLEKIGVDPKGKHCVVVGASNLVGRPLALELLLSGATVTVCHRFTTNLEQHVRQAEILCSAVGKPGVIPGGWIRDGAVVLDIGITRMSDGKLRGDVEFEAARKRAAWIAPVPGGVGPMTVAMLLQNTLRSRPRAASTSACRPGHG
ncbi:MAG: bifunctional methylenetetrahydrofolate dehydrogenase/methenyltetrahydrofolate cyclohydrolase FolD, partial [Gammaproteobacteria bacterium]|nr:bifunctional methylenetetrahydrofolate dehydrogenase/methenyltetrahydrofolate cyclohydrolase FolD [Gammaproteobacteria bacterium]